MSTGQGEQHHDEHDGGHSESEVTITINGEAYRIHRGARTGLEIRQLAGKPSTYSLKLLPELTEIDPAGKITIKGGEQFSCTEKMGQG